MANHEEAGAKRSPLSVRETVTLLAIGFSLVFAGAIAWERVASRLDHIGEALTERRAEFDRRLTDMAGIRQELREHISQPAHPGTLVRLEELERRVERLEKADGSPRQP